MNCPRKTLGLAAAVLLALPLTLLPQQQPPPPPPAQTGSQQGGQPTSQGQVIRIPATEVVVPVTVKDGNGQIVNNLEIGDFRILEDDVEQKITRMTVDPYPLSVVILFDAALKPNFEKQLQASIRAIAAGFGDSDEAAIYRFADYPNQICDFITGPDELLTQLKRLQISTSHPMKPDYSATTPTVPRINGGQVPAGGTPPATIQIFGNGTKSVNDALYAAAQLLRTRPRERRKIIFLISDGVDSKVNTYNFPVTLQMLQRAEASVYSIGIGTPLTGRLKTILRDFADESGGDIFWASNSHDLENLYPAVAEQARFQYTLIYSPEHKERAVTFHSIEVRVKRPGLDVHTRKGYFSAPPQ